MLVTHCEFFAKRSLNSDFRSLSIIFHSFLEIKSTSLDSKTQHQLFASVLVRRRSEIAKLNALDFSTLLLFACKADLEETSRCLLLENMIPLIPEHMPKIGLKGFGSMCFSLSFLSKDQLSQDLYYYMESEFLARIGNKKTEQEYSANGKINCSMLLLLANGEPVYGSDETYDLIYSNMLVKNTGIKHVGDLESLLFYYQHSKIKPALE